MDQKATTQNYVSDEPFRDSRDVVDRLLPFHIWQVHDQDLDVAVKSRERKVAGEITCWERLDFSLTPCYLRTAPDYADGSKEDRVGAPD
jgi:hypothetical protein